MIYYVEDDDSIRELTIYALTSQGLEVRGFSEAGAFKAACLKRSPDLILLDIMLPGEDGLSLLSWVRSSSFVCRVPVMMLTAKGTEYDKVTGLDAGADDYLAKPFGMMELVSRCKAHLRRASASYGPGSRSDIVTVGALSLSEKDHRAFAGDVELELTLKEFELLGTLMDNPGRVFSRSQLLADVWDIAFAGETRTVDAHIQTLRRKINDALPGAGSAIETVRGVGYRLVERHP